MNGEGIRNFLLETKGLIMIKLILKIKGGTMMPVDMRQNGMRRNDAAQMPAACLIIFAGVHGSK